MSRLWWLTDCTGSCTGTQGRLSEQMPSVFDLGEMAALLYMDYSGRQLLPLQYCLSISIRITIKALGCWGCQLMRITL